MSVEILFISFFAWSVFVTVIYSLIDEDWVAMAFYACAGSIAAASPIGFFLLVDGEWCRGDCMIIAYHLYVVSFAVFLGRAGDWISGLARKFFSSLVGHSRDARLNPGARSCDDRNDFHRHPAHPTGS